MRILVKANTARPLIMARHVCCTVPVSYTHLDVYKRQFLRSLAGLGIVLFGIGPYIIELFKAMQDMFSF